MSNKNIYILLILLLTASHAFAQEFTKGDSLKLQRGIEGEDGIHLDPLMGKEPNFLLDITMPQTRAEIKYPLVYMDIKITNDYPNLNEIDFKRGYFFSKHYNRFWLKVRMIGTDDSFYINSNISYELLNNFLVDFTRVHNNTSRINPLIPPSMHRDEFGLGLSFKITPNLKFKTGIERSFNKSSGKWEWLQMNTLNYGF